MRGHGRTSADGLGPNEKKGFFHFLNLIFNAKTFPKNPRKCFKARKNTQKIPKILGKFPETDWDTNNPNKIFGAHEKKFRAF
jgi:hypothetical protein